MIVPLYKGGKYCDGIIEMINNNYSSIEPLADIEVIFVNDSPEETINLNYDLSRIKMTVLQHKINKGIHRSRIDGLINSLGEIVHFLDQDDIIADDFYYEQMLKMESKDAIVCNGTWKDNEPIYSGECEDWNTYSNGMPRVIVSPGQVIMRRDRIPKEWIWNPLENNGCDDLFLWYLMLKDNRQFALNADNLFEHRKTDENASDNVESMQKSKLEIMSIISRISIDEDIKRQIESDLKKRIVSGERHLSIINRLKKIGVSDKGDIRFAVYGYGKIGKQFVKALERGGYHIPFIVDRNPNSIQCDDNHKLYQSVEDIDVRVFDYIVITPLNGRKEIINRLDQMGVHNYIGIEKALDMVCTSNEIENDLPL